LVVLLGVAAGDTVEDAQELARKTAELRIFSDADGRFNLSLLDVGGEALVVSQFTLLSDTRKGRRPSFTRAAPPEEAEPLVEAFAAALRETGVEVGMGRFGARMLVEIHNQGPVTIVLDSEEFERPRRG
jgi:D-tyrosyl-tRNA(Tyr) deacylase